MFALQDVWEVVEKSYKESSNETTLSPNQMDFLKNIRKRDKKALTIIYEAMDKVTSKKILSISISKEAREMLQNIVDKCEKFVLKLLKENLKVCTWKYHN